MPNERVPRKTELLPETEILKITDSLYSEGMWAIGLQGNEAAKIRKKFNDISENITREVENRRVENKKLRDEGGESKGWADTLELVKTKKQEWEDFRQRYDSNGNLKPLN